LVEEFLMSTATREQVLEKIAELGVPLEYVFLIAEDDDPLGEIVIWNPEVGLRGIIIEDDQEAAAVFNHLRDAGSRQFKSWDELNEAEKEEKWEGRDTCADYRRRQQTVESLTKKSAAS
jgi:hypothetical protein